MIAATEMTIKQLISMALQKMDEISFEKAIKLVDMLD